MNPQLRKVQKKAVPPIENGIKMGAGRYTKTSGNQIISGYFVKEKSYRELVIARINTFLCALLGFLVMVCLVSYYFVTMGEVSLN